MRFSQRVLLVLPYLVLFPLALCSQLEKDGISFHHIHAGLSQSSVSKIFEDSHGFLWLGTSNGFNRFDGTKLQKFEKNLEGTTDLSYGYVGDIYEDENKLLFFGTDQGLYIYDHIYDRVSPYPFKHDSLQIRSRNYKSITKNDNVLWLGTYTSGLYRYDIETGKTGRLYFNESNKGQNNNKVIKVASLDSERSIVITEGGIYIIDNELRIEKKLEDFIGIRSAIGSAQQGFLIGSKGGELLLLDILNGNEFATQIVSVSPGFSILSLEEDTKGNIWIGSENDGLIIYDVVTKKQKKFKNKVSDPNSVPGNSIWSIYRAKNGVMWLGAFKKGLSFFDPDYYKFTHIKNDPFNTKSLSNNIVNCFQEDQQGNLWIGTDGGGLNYWDRRENVFEHYTLDNGRLNSNVVLALLPDDQNKLWIGTWANGLTEFDKKSKGYKVWNTKNSFLASNNVMDLVKDAKGRIWIATLFGGLQYYDPRTGTHQDFILRSTVDSTITNTVAQLFVDNEGAVWAGTQSAGLFKLIENNNGWNIVHYHSLNKKRNISNNFINTIVADEQKNIWVGTQAGLNKYRPKTDSFESVTKADGLINDAIKGIIFKDNGVLWLSTENGIIRYHHRTGDKLNYDMGDGLQGNVFNASSQYKTASGEELVFGGSNGFNIFTQEQAKKRKDNPKVYISGLKVFNKAVIPNDESGILKQHIYGLDTLTLSHRDAVVNFEFNALTYRHPEKVNYAYFLEGFETDWNYVGNVTSATYTNLNPGDYTLRIKSTNSDGIWVDNEAKLFIAVTPPYWKTWWFQMMVAALIVLCLYIVHHLKVKNIKQNQIRLEEQIADRTKELQQQKNKLVHAAEELSSKNEEIQQFTYAVSHDLKSPLNSIKGLISLIPGEIVITDFPNLEKFIDMIVVSCNTMSELITDITEIARLGQIDNKNDLLDTNEIMELARSLISGKLNTKKVNLTIAENLPKIYGDRNRMIQVFGNFIDNAVKYMGDQQDPLITINAKENGATVDFLVSDNGSGMDEKALKKLFTPFVRFHADVKGTGLGLYMTKKIAVSHGGAITAESAGKGKGATFILTLPKAEIAAKFANVNDEVEAVRD